MIYGISSTSDPQFVSFRYILFSYFTDFVGTTKLRNENETKRNEIQRNETKNEETKRNETKRNEVGRHIIDRLQEELWYNTSVNYFPKGITLY
jgi:hypothetical protein